MNSTVIAGRPPSDPAPARPGGSAGRVGDARVTVGRLVRSEWVKLRSLRSTYFSLASVAGAVIGLGLLFTALTANRYATAAAAQRAALDPTGVSLRGFYLAQLIIGVLGVLIVSGEYGTGMIRATMCAAPRRLPVLWAKAIVFTVATFVTTLVISLVAFVAGQAVLSGQHLETTLGAPGVLRAVLGTALYLTGVGLLGQGLGWMIRNTAGAIATVFALLLVLPVLVRALPDTWQPHVSPYLPGNAGTVITVVHPDPGGLAPWTGFGVFCIYVAVAVVAGAIVLRRRDV